MDARRVAVSLVSAVIVTAALSICQINGQSIDCHNTNCVGPDCAIKFDDYQLSRCAACATLVSRSGAAVTSVTRRCTGGFERYLLGCKVNVTGLTSDELCVCSTPKCNGVFSDATNTNQPQQCVQCRYQDEIGKGTDICNNNPTDASLTVTCPSGNRCATEFHKYQEGNLNANRYCAVWNKADGCYNDTSNLGLFGVVCFCSGNGCNKATVSAKLPEVVSRPPESSKSTDLASSPPQPSRSTDLASPSPKASASFSTKPTGSPSRGGAAKLMSDSRSVALSLFLTITPALLLLDSMASAPLSLTST